jgi:hypothetical protein
MQICYGCYIAQESLSLFYNVKRSAIRRRFAIIPGSHHDLALCRESPVRVDTSGSGGRPAYRCNGW